MDLTKSSKNVKEEEEWGVRSFEGETVKGQNSQNQTSWVAIIIIGSFFLIFFFLNLYIYIYIYTSGGA